MTFLIKNLFLKTRKLILKLEKISAQGFNFLQRELTLGEYLPFTFVYMKWSLHLVEKIFGCQF